MITKDDILKLAGLARMELSLSEVEHLTGEVDSILVYVGQITNTTGDLVRKVPDLHNVMRDDIQQNEPREYTEKLLSNAPFREGDYLKVKKILGNSDDII